MNAKLVYALKYNDLVHISEVESGLKCECICPQCGSKLIARKGSKMMHHFAHYKAEECYGGLETSLHLAAKDIIASANKFRIPEVKLNFDSYKEPELISASKLIDVDNVYLEKKIDEIIPDIIVESKGHKLLVEVFVTHKIDDEKLRKIKKLGISTIEIDLSSWVEEQNQQELHDVLINGVEEKAWVYNSVVEKYDALFTKAAKGPSSWSGYCPLNKSIWNGKSSVRWVDCIYCEYCYSAHGSPHCLGYSLIRTIDDLKKPYETLKQEWEIKFNEDKERRIERGLCPSCSNGHLVERNGKNGKFFGCSNYPHCRYSK